MVNMKAISQQHQDAALSLIQLSPEDRLSLLAAVEGDALQEAEAAKKHPLTADKFTKSELEALKAHMLDGGGVVDDSGLIALVIQALLDDDWEDFLHHLPHVAKWWLKNRGVIVPVPGGGVAIHGYGPTAASPKGGQI